MILNNICAYLIIGLCFGFLFGVLMHESVEVFFGTWVIWPFVVGRYLWRCIKETVRET